MTAAARSPRSAAAQSADGHRDPVEWARHFWRSQRLGPGEDAFLAMSSVMRFHQIMTDVVHTNLKPHKLNLTDYMLLMTLQLSETGTRLISNLARNLLVHATTATLATDRLEARGLLKRTPHPTDRRATLVSITDSGRALVREASRSLSAIGFGLAGTTKADRLELIDLLARLRSVSGDLNS
jgi:DNA-binding MarR family transcriptional regulator